MEENKMEDQFRHLPERLREREIEKTLRYIEENYEDESPLVDRKVEPKNLSDIPAADYEEIVININSTSPRRENNIEPSRRTQRTARMRTSNQELLDKKRKRDEKKTKFRNFMESLKTEIAYNLNIYRRTSFFETMNERRRNKKKYSKFLADNYDSDMNDEEECERLLSLIDMVEDLEKGKKKPFKFR